MSSYPFSFSHTKRNQLVSSKLQKEKRGETTRQTQKQKGRHRTDVPEDWEETGSSPSPRQEVNLDKRVRVAVVVPGGQVPGLQHVDDQVPQVPVIVDLELWAKKHGGRGDEVGVERELEPLLEDANKSRALRNFLPEFLL